MKNIFKRSKKVHTMYGITEIEWLKAHDKLNYELYEAKKRQKSEDAPPSAYMRGIQFAIDVLDAYAPHAITMEV